jgi:type II secretory ATPase GspE/PulE/Tfp pilus assembly ATPase PilB-like protein
LKAIAKYESQLAREIGGDKQSSIKDDTITRLWRAKGCESCLGTGYRGRVGLYEILTNSPTMERLIMSRTDTETLDKQSRRENAVTMRTDGLVKALCAITSIEEILAKTEE